MLKKLSVKHIVELIENHKTFSAITPDNAFSITINDYVPYICTAIHNGHNLRSHLRNKISLNRIERWQEEDPLTGLFISSMPIHIICNDSRYEYDLNKAPLECIYDIIWGTKVWSYSLSKEDKALSKQKHHNFYIILETLVKTLLEKHKTCILYDIHSYNHKIRKYPEAPLFNVGTKNLKTNKYNIHINSWLNELSKIKIPHVKNTTAKNTVFYGKGYLAKHISHKFPKALVLPTEIKKVYCDEISGDEYPVIINKLSNKLKIAFINHAASFIEKTANIKVSKKHNLLSSKLNSVVIEADQQIFNLVKQIDLLHFINPSNVESEKKKFLQPGSRHKPNFTYKPLNIDIKEIKKQLYQVSLSKIKDVDIKTLYNTIIDDYASQLDMLQARGTKDFLYASLKHFGEPDKQDVLNAHFLMHCAEIKMNKKDLELIDANAVKILFEKECHRYQLNYKIKLVQNMPAMAAFSPLGKSFKIKKDALFTKRFAKGLAHHEVGLHAVTTANADLQPLHILKTGLPGDTSTQEGLALLSEFLSGFLDIDRLQEVALRVIAVEHMVAHYDFVETFKHLINKFDISHEKAFYITLRVYRGGGFTKDFVYLKGFREILNLYQKKNFNYLLIGKTASKYLPILEELINRNILKKPKYIPYPFRAKIKVNPIMDYVVHGLA